MIKASTTSKVMTQKLDSKNLRPSDKFTLRTESPYTVLGQEKNFVKCLYRKKVVRISHRQVNWIKSSIFEMRY